MWNRTQKTPCFQCAEKELYCHGRCDRYFEYKKEVERVNHSAEKQRRTDNDIKAILINGNKSKSDTTSNTESIYEDTPMNLLDSDSVRNLEYATNVTYNNSKDHSEAEGNATGDDVKNELGEKHHHQIGFTVSQSELFLKYREAVSNIDMLVIKELESLFMGLW